MIDQHDREGDTLLAARAAYDRMAWDEAYRQLAAADAEAALDAGDLQRLAESAYLSGRDRPAEDSWARAHHAFLDAGDVPTAVRCAFWLGLVLITDVGAAARGGGWISRAHRLLDQRVPEDCAERGHLLLPEALRELDDGDASSAYDLFSQAAAVGERFEEADLTALGRLGQGQSLIRLGQAQRGAETLDEAMVAVGAGEVSPVATGLIYCAVILACQQICDVRRAQQWTDALSSWCDAQPGLVPFRGQCLVHRSELAQLRGDWDTAITEADRACRWLSDPPRQAAGMAFYQRAQLHRLQGEIPAAEAAFTKAIELGHDPHPGLALLRRDQGRTEAAATAIRRHVDAAPDWYPRLADEVDTPHSRAASLEACVEIMLAAGDGATADAADAELIDMAETLQTELVTAMSTRAHGAVLLHGGEADAALPVLARAQACWTALRAPYDTGRVRVLKARALQDLGDHDTAAVERDAAARAFTAVGAAPDLERLSRAAASTDSGTEPGLTPRETQIIRLVAEGQTNQEIADALTISGKTVARHLHNVYTKLGLPNRSAATAYAYEHDLI